MPDKEIKKAGSLPATTATNLNNQGANLSQKVEQVNGSTKYLVDHEKRIKWFWYPETDKEGDTKSCKIDHLNYIGFLRQEGFRRYDIEENFTFIRIINNRIREASLTEIQDFIIRYVKDFFSSKPANYFLDIDEEMVLNTFYRSPQTYFSKPKLSLIGTEPFELNQDTLDIAFFYFRNGFVEVSKAGITLRDYKHLKATIWENQVLDRDYSSSASEESNWKKFVWNISGKKEKRYQSIRTIIGYLSHSFFEYTLRAANFTDSKISEFDEGRTGKTLLSRAIGKVRNMTEIAGKSFRPEEEKKYQEVKMDTQVVHINDASSRLNFELLFNDITDGMRVRRLYKEPFTLKAKMIISTNKPLAVHGSSSLARVVEFEFADHYSKEFTPETEFGQWFFRDWNESDWASFDCFMLNCVHEYFVYGLLEAEEINLSQRKLINETSKEFVEFMTDCFDDENGQREPFLRYGHEFDIKELFQKFVSEFEEYGQNARRLSQTMFTKHLKLYALHKKIKVEQKKSGSRRSLIYYTDIHIIKVRQNEFDF